MRQTNAVWVAFIAAHIALEACLPITKGTRSRKGGAVVPGAALLSTLRVVLRRMWTLKWHLAGQLWPLAAVVVAFGAFVVHNGGIVVGDKANHAPVRHLMQPLYFALYFTGALAPVFWNGEAMKKTVRYVWSEAQRSPALAGAALAAAVAGGVWAVNHGTLVHPFLLADNRHYTFYLWRRVVNVRPWARFALLPLYLYSVGAVDARLAAGGHHALERVLLAATTCIVLIPAHLIEFRYFTVPFYATLLSMEAPPPRQLAAVVTLFAACNAASLYVFLARPFHWADGSIARFLW